MNTLRQRSVGFEGEGGWAVAGSGWWGDGVETCAFRVIMNPRDPKSMEHQIGMMKF